MKYRYAAFSFFLLCLISFPGFSLETLLGDEKEGFYLEWPEKEWCLEAEEKIGNHQTVSLKRIPQGDFTEKAKLTAEPLPEKGFSSFFDSYLENEKEKNPGVEVEMLPQNIKGECDNRLLLLVERKQGQPSRCSVLLLIQGERFLYSVRRETDNFSKAFVNNSIAFLLMARILDSENILLIRKKIEEVEKVNANQVKGAAEKAAESDLKELDSLIGEEVEEEVPVEDVSIFEPKKKNKPLSGKGLKEKEAPGLSAQNQTTEARESVGETSVTSETEKLSIEWDTAEDWTILSTPLPETEEAGMEEEVASDKPQSIKVFHSTENEENWTEKGEIKIIGGPLKEEGKADGLLGAYIQKVFQKELQKDPQASLKITEDRFSEASNSRFFIIKGTQGDVRNIQVHLIFFGKKSFYEINRIKRGTDAFLGSEKKFIDFLKTARLMDTGIAGDENQKSGDGNEEIDETIETLDTDTDTDTETDTKIGTGAKNDTNTDTDTITDTDTDTDTDTETDTKTGTGAKNDTNTDTDTITDTDTDTDTDTETDTKTGTGTENDTNTDTDTITDTDTDTDIEIDPEIIIPEPDPVPPGPIPPGPFPPPHPTPTGTSTGTNTYTGTGRDQDDDDKDDDQDDDDDDKDDDDEKEPKPPGPIPPGPFPPPHPNPTGTSTGTNTYTGTDRDQDDDDKDDDQDDDDDKKDPKPPGPTPPGPIPPKPQPATGTSTGTATDTDISEGESKAMEEQDQQEEVDKTNKMFDDQRRSLIKKHLENVLETKADYESASNKMGASSMRNSRLNAEEQDWGKARVTINDIEKRRKEFNDSLNETEEGEE